MTDIISFLKSLTDTSCVPVQPSSLPMFHNRPEWNQRKPGGEYLNISSHPSEEREYAGMRKNINIINYVWKSFLFKYL